MINDHCPTNIKLYIKLCVKIFCVQCRDSFTSRTVQHVRRREPPLKLSLSGNREPGFFHHRLEGDSLFCALILQFKLWTCRRVCRGFQSIAEVFLSSDYINQIRRYPDILCWFQYQGLNNKWSIYLYSVIGSQVSSLVKGNAFS